MMVQRTDAVNAQIKGIYLRDKKHTIKLIVNKSSSISNVGYNQQNFAVET